MIRAYFGLLMNVFAGTTRLSTDALPFRMCVGILLLNRAGQVWVGRRRPKWAADHTAKIWQMPQGGIEKHEPPRIAALRELREETGVTSVEVLEERDDWLSYELPDDLIGVALKGRYAGQNQKWFAMRFLGDDSEIDILPKLGAKAEFESWRWAPIDAVPKLIVPYKRALYERVVADFRHHASTV